MCRGNRREDVFRDHLDRDELEFKAGEVTRGVLDDDEEQLKAFPGNDLRKQFSTCLTRSQTSTKNEWVIETPGMGNCTSVLHAM
jgi:hypothetical protein